MAHVKRSLSRRQLGWIPHVREFVAFVKQSRVGIKDAIFIFSLRPLRPHHYLRDSYQSVLLRLLWPPPHPSALLVLDQQLRFDIHVAAWLRCKREAGVSQVILPLSLSPVSLVPPPPPLLLPPLPPVSWCQHCLVVMRTPQMLSYNSPLWSEVQLIFDKRDVGA